MMISFEEFLSLLLFTGEYLMLPGLLFLGSILQKKLIGESRDHESMKTHIYLSGLEVHLIFLASKIALLLRTCTTHTPFKGAGLENKESFLIMLIAFAVGELFLIGWIMWKTKAVNSTNVRSSKKITFPYRLIFYLSMPMLMILIYIFWLNFEIKSGYFTEHPWRGLAVIIVGTYLVNYFVFTPYSAAFRMTEYLEKAAVRVIEKNYKSALRYYEKAERIKRNERQAIEGFIYSLRQLLEGIDKLSLNERRKTKKALRYAVIMFKSNKGIDDEANELLMDDFKFFCQKLQNKPYCNKIISRIVVTEIRNSLESASSDNFV